MKEFIRLILLNSFSLYIVASFYQGLTIPKVLTQLLWAGLIFTLVNQLIKPLIKLFLLPINLLTLGLFGWVSNVIVLIIVTKIVPQLSVSGFTSKTFTYSGFVIPSLTLSLAASLIIASFFLSFINNFLDKLLREN